MKGKLLFSFTLICFISLQLYLIFFRKDLNFQDIQNGQNIKGTDFIYDIQSTEIGGTSGTTIEQKVVYLVNPKTGSRFKISFAVMNADNFYFSETPDGIVCHRCVDVIHSKNRIYLITRRNGGGSGRYFFHEVLEISDDHVQVLARHLSCGRAYVRNSEIVFPSRNSKCPKLLPDFDQDAWQYEIFDLSNNLSYVQKD